MLRRGKHLLSHKKKFPRLNSNPNKSTAEESLHDAGQTRTSPRQSVRLQCQCGKIFCVKNWRTLMLQHCLGANNVCNTDVLVVHSGYKQHIANSAYCKMKKMLDQVGKVIGDYATTGVRINQDSPIEPNHRTKYPSKDIICQNVCTSTSSKAQLYSSGHPPTTNVSVIEQNCDTNLKKRHSQRLRLLS